MDPRVLYAMLPYDFFHFRNPHSRTDIRYDPTRSVETARSQVAALINASPEEIVFTSGASESNNISINGVAHFSKKGGKSHIITTQNETECALESCSLLEVREDFDVTYLPDGIVDLEELRSAIRPDTGLVSIMAVNRDFGVIQPMEEIGKICKEFNVPFHTDAAQALGKIPIDVNKWLVNLVSLSGHEIYGPQGVGALYMRRQGGATIGVESLINGDLQNPIYTKLAVGMGAACELVIEEMKYVERRITALEERLLNEILSKYDGVVVNVRCAGTLNVSIPYLSTERLLIALREGPFYDYNDPSPILNAYGVDGDLVYASVRVRIGRFTTEADIDRAVELIVKKVDFFRSCPTPVHVNSDPYGIGFLE